MNRQKYWIAVILFTVILPTMPSAGVELSRPGAYLLGKPHLAGIERLSVVVPPVVAETDEIAFDRIGLKSKLERKLKDAGIDVLAAGSGYSSPNGKPADNIPELRIYIAALKLDPQRYVFYIETSLATTVTIPVKPHWSFNADIWKSAPAMTVIAAGNIANSLEKVIFSQVDEFILAQRLVNTKESVAKIANAANAVKKSSTDTRKSQQTRYKFAASKNGKVFHKPDCSFVKRINPENVVTYESAEEAVKAGKRPCKLCKP